MKGFERITFDPNIMGGQACIRGMRVPVSLVVNLVANGMKTEDILNEYPDLEPEWAYKGEITVSHRLFDVGNLSVASFMNRVHDMIYHSGRLGIYHNVEKVSLDGVEISGTFVVPKFEMFSTLTLLDARDGKDEKLEYRPSWKIDTVLNYKITGGIRFHLTSRVVGRRWTETDTYLNSYHVENIGVFLWESRSISPSISLKNIFDVNFEEEYGFPMAGRTIWVGMDWRWSRT